MQNGVTDVVSEIFIDKCGINVCRSGVTRSWVKLTGVSRQWPTSAGLATYFCFMHLECIMGWYHWFASSSPPLPPSFLLDMHVREIVVVVGWWVVLAIGKNPTRCQSGGRVCKGSQL